MKLRISISLFILFSNSVWAKVSIQGKILGYDRESIVSYYPIIEGIVAPYWKEIKPSANGAFKIEFENEGYGSVRVFYKRMFFRFFHEANSKIYFEIKEVKPSNKRIRLRGDVIFNYYDSIKNISLIKIRGDYDEINKFYNTNLRSSYFTTRMVDGNYYSKLIYNSSSPTSAMALLDSLKQVEINQINRLPITINTENQVNEIKQKEIRGFLLNEVNAFYGAVFLNGMRLKRKEQNIRIMKDSTVQRNIYNSDWEFLTEELYKQAKENLTATTSSPDYIDFAEAMATALSEYKKYSFPNPSTPLDGLVIKALFDYDTTLFRDEKAKFAHELNGLEVFLNSELFYSPTLLHGVHDLQAKHLTSKYFDFYREKIEKLKKSLEASKQDFRKGKIIEARYDSFDELLKRFGGKNLFIDIWATWCHPCIEEFKYKSVIQPFIESDKIEVLYISIDKQQWKDRWKQSIKINELQGYHFRADEKFIVDMWNVIGDSGSYAGAIPHYMLIDKEGKIFRSVAARPSDGDELIKQIELLINN